MNDVGRIAFRGVPLESMVRGEREHVPATCRQRGQRRKLICHTSLLVYVATVPHFFSGTPPFFAHPSINTNNTVNRVNVGSWRKVRENSSTVQCKPRELNLVRSMVEPSERENLIQRCCFHVTCTFCSSLHSMTTSICSKKFECKPFLVFPHRQSQMSSRMGEVRAR